MNFELRSLFRRKSPSSAPAPVSDSDEFSVPQPPGQAADPIVAGRKLLPPDPRIIQAIGRNHSFESAVADLVDNSLDAVASKILIRFMREGDDLVGFYLADNGRGMDEAAIDRAMTLGGQRNYEDVDLGHFGVGLKAASLSQARSLTVVSKSAHHRAVGRRLHSDTVADGFACDLLTDEFAVSVIEKPWGHLQLVTGTVVIWNDVKVFPQIGRVHATDAFLDDMIGRLCRHLGLVFHRIISSKGIEIVVDQADLKTDEASLPFQIGAIDPFGYAKSGRADYPRTLKADLDGASLALRCHIWPRRSNDPKFRLGGMRAEPPQGFFIYRNDRLLHSGSWHGVTLAKPELQLARIEIDMPSNSNLFEMNPEKTHVEPTRRFSQLVHAASDHGADFDKFLQEAEACYRESRKRNFERQRVIQPGSGIAPVVKSAIAGMVTAQASSRRPCMWGLHRSSWPRTAGGGFLRSTRESWR